MVAARIYFTLGGTSLTQSTTINGISYEVAYDGTEFVITEPSGAEIPIADLNELLENAIYLNDTDEPAAGDRTFGVTVTDGDLNSNTAFSTIAVLPINEAPIAGDDTATTPADTAVAITIGLDDTDPESDSLTVVMINGLSVNTGDSVSVADGTVTVNGDGTLTFMPNAGFTATQLLSIRFLTVQLLEVAPGILCIKNRSAGLVH